MDGRPVGVGMKAVDRGIRLENWLTLSLRSLGRKRRWLETQVYILVGKTVGEGERKRQSEREEGRKRRVD